MDEKKPEATVPFCTCAQDLFADVPPDPRPRPVLNMGGLRKVTCPGCQLVYWTNRKTDLCAECEKECVRVPENRKEG
jgi:hypothetical protein